ncbi:MAG: metallophosphoesterase, partial [Oscillospiraceae bacterium]|nr:metallophosphoesterase [Oscillospiraceae bacterium]
MTLFPLSSVLGATVPGSSKDGNLRVLLTSDMHYCTSAYYGVKGTDRLQLWVNSVIAEHNKEPIDLIIVNGDMSLDHFYSNGKIAGSYMGDNKVSYTEKFVKEYISQLPSEIPVRFVAGNHEQYNSTQWKTITGNERQCSYRIEGNLFILLDNYNSFLEPNVTENSVYTLSDMDFIQSEMAKYPDDKVWLVAHYFDANRESEAFKTLVKENDRIMGLFGGHDHMGDVKNTTAWGNRPYSMCGTFALSGTVTAEHSKGQPQQFGYTEKTLTEAQQESLDLTLANFWGFRELKITPTSAKSNYISVATGSTAPYFYGKKIVLSRTTKYSVTYTLPTSTAVWGPASDGIYYIGSAADMQAFCAMGQSYNFAGKTVKLARDIDMTGINWTMIPQFSGTFDGCGRAVKNLSLYATSGTLAMFDQLQDATIKNLRMVDGEVKLVDSHSAAGIAVRANGNCLFSNVYCKMTVSVDSDCYRAGGFLAFPERANLTFENCVSQCTVSGMRGSGFVSQVNYNTYSTVFKDCAFIGDLSGAGKWSGGIVGLCAGNVSMERCVSLGKASTNGESGGLIFIDHQNQSETTSTEVYLKDCYGAMDTQVPIGTQASRSFRLKFTLEYTGKTPLVVNTSSTNLLASHQSSIQSKFGYLSKGSTVNLTTSNLTTICPALTDWGYATGTVSYGTSKTVPKILPTVTWNLINGKSVTNAPSSVCTLCGGNKKPAENLGNGTHKIACDRMLHSIEPHSYSKGKCVCGQRECPYLLVDFLPTSVAHEASDWVPTERDTGMLSFTVDPNNRGTMEATVQYRDAYVSMANPLEKNYLIQEGDVIEVRLKATITAGSCPRTTVYFTTDAQTGYNESHQVTHAMTFNGNYQTVTMGNLDSYVGQSVRTLRIDVFQNASSDLVGTYSLDYIYVGPAQYAPSQGSRALYFDFSDDEYSAQRYGSTTYRGYNYDVGDNWRRGETGAQPYVANGKLCFDITERYNASNEPVHITAIEPVGTVKTFSWGNDNKYANDLAYDPSSAEVLQIRMKLTDVQHYYPNSTKQYLRFFYLPEGATEWSCGTAPNDWAESILVEIPDCYMDGGEKEGEFFTLTISLKGKKFSTYESIRGIMLNFMGMRGGKAEIDYLYVGPALEDHLLFDFNGAGAQRYDTLSYGMMDYDSTEHWYREVDVADLQIANGLLTITNAATSYNDHTQYAETSKTDKRMTDPLHFTPKAGDIVQLRYSLLSYDASLNSGKIPTITIYGWDNGKTSADYYGTSWVSVDTTKLGSYFTYTCNIPTGWTNYDLGRIRITPRGLLNSKLAVDYLYVGSPCKAPEPQHSYTYKASIEPTASATGTLTGTCSKCSATVTVTLPKLTNTDYTKTTTTAPTCTATGVDKYTWKTTTYGSFSFNVTTAAKGHTSVADPAVSATCTATGLTAGAHCSVCNTVLTAQTTVAALGHNYSY